MTLATEQDLSTKYRLDSWAQEGEDLVLRRFFEGQKQGLYVDVGAHHPWQYSNTFWFYRRGWRGINIDAMPGSMDAFQLHRPEDVNLELAISDSGEPLTYHMFNKPALNGLNPTVSARRDGNTHGDRIVSRIQVSTRPLASVLDEHLPPDVHTIDFLTVDVEGHDLEVLRSNDWKRYRPRMVLAEDLAKYPLDQLGQSPLVQYLRGVGYAVCAKTFNTLFFEQTA